MDDLWGNAWGDTGNAEIKPEPDKPLKVEEETKPEPVVGILVWHATEPEVPWQAEIETKTTAWGEDSSPWDRPTETVELKEESPPASPVEEVEDEPAPTLPASSPKVEVRISSPEPDESPTEFTSQDVKIDEEHHSPFRSQSPTSPIPTSPDAFGSFATGHEDLANEPGWTSPGISNQVTTEVSEDPGWGSAWSGKEEEEPQKDEWAAAQEEQLKRNKRVPPAVIEAILDKWKEMEEAVWPAEKEETGSWQHDRIEDIEKIARLIETFLPPLSLQPPVSFSSTAIQKNLHTTLKLTKSYQIALSSPLAHMRPSGGSDAWETHVKTYQEIDPAQLDLWAVDAAKPIEVPVDDRPKFIAPEKKASSGWNFWNRKQSSISQTRPASAASGGGSKASPVTSTRPSIERSASPKPSVDLPPSLIATPAPMSTSIKPSTPAPSIPSISSPPLFEPSRPSDDFEEPQIQPSGISRFFSRLSRNKDAGPNKISNRHSSFLSSNDIDFLSDVPSYSDEGTGEDQLQSLEKMLSSPSSNDVPIPVLAPPPKLAPPPQIIPSPMESSRHGRDLSLNTSKAQTDDEFMDFLGAPSKPALSPNKSPQTASSGTFRHTLPSPISPTSGSSSAGRTPSSQVTTFGMTSPPDVSRVSAGYFPSARQSTSRNAPQNDLSALMDFGMGSPKVAAPAPPLLPAKNLLSPQSVGIRNDIEDDFDSFVGSNSNSNPDESFDSFADSSFASFAGSSNSYNEDHQQHHRDASFDRDVTNFLNGGSSSAQTLATIAASPTVTKPQNASNDFDDFPDFFGSSNNTSINSRPAPRSMSYESQPSSPPPQPPSKPSTPLQQSFGKQRPSVAKLGAKKVSITSPPRGTTSPAAPLLPPPPGNTIRRPAVNVMDDPIASFTLGTPMQNGSKQMQNEPLPGLEGSMFQPSSSSSNIPAPGISKSPPPILKPITPNMTGGSRPSSTVPTIPKPSTGSGVFSVPPPIPTLSKSPPPPLVPAAPTRPSLSGGKGLSAQDLSFFEGL